MSKRLALRQLLIRGKTGVEAARLAGYTGTDRSLAVLASRERSRLEREQNEMAAITTEAAVRRTREIIDSQHSGRFDHEAVYGALRDALVLHEHLARSKGEAETPVVTCVYCDADKDEMLRTGVLHKRVNPESVEGVTNGSQ